MGKIDKEKLAKQMENLESLMNNMPIMSKQQQMPMPGMGNMMYYQMPMGGMNYNYMMNPMVMQMMRMEMLLRDVFMTVHEIHRIVLELKEHELEDDLKRLGS